MRARARTVAGVAGPERVPCVGAIVRDAAGRLLLVRRANPPAQGTWSLPGGRVEPGESDPDALRREVAEETGLHVAVGPLVGTVERTGPDGTAYVINDHECAVRGGELRAGDDASEVGWFSPAELVDLDTAPHLVDSLAGWGVLPHPR